MLVHNVNEAPKANIYVHVGVRQRAQALWARRAEAYR